MRKRALPIAVVIALGTAHAAPLPRQVVQAGPSGPLAVSKDGYVAVVDAADSLHIYQLSSRTLVRSIPSSKLTEGAGLVHPVLPLWDDATGEVLLVRGGDILAIDIAGKRTVRPFSTGRLWPVGGGGRARWIAHTYGDAQVVDAGFQPLGNLPNSQSIAAAANGGSALVATKDGLVRFTLDPVAKQQTIPLPAPADTGMMGVRLAVTSDGGTAVVCLKLPQYHQAVIVRGLGKQPTVTPIAWAGDMIGCELAISELHDIVVVAAIGEVRGFDLATGALRWQAPREYSVNTGIDSELAVHGRTVLVSWQGLLLLDLLRGDAIGQIGTDIARPEHMYFLRGDQLLTMRPTSGSFFALPSVELATWSLKDGRRTHAGSASWGWRSQVSEDGALVTLRVPNATKGNPCWTFARGTTADGAPPGQATTGKWPPAPNSGRATCLPASAKVVGSDLARGALAVYDNGKHQIVPMSGNPVTLDTSKAMGFATALTFSPDGNWVMGGLVEGAWGSLHVFDTKTGAHRGFSGSAKDSEAVQIGGNPRKGFNAFAVSADSRQLLVGGEDEVTLYTLATKQPVRSFTIASGFVTAVGFAPGALLAGTSDGRFVVSRGKTQSEAASDGGAIKQLVVRSDGKRAATVSDDGAVRIWDLAKPALLATLVEASDGESFASTPGGAYVGGREAAAQLGWVFDGPTEGFAFERFAATLARPDLVAKRLADATTDLGVTIVRPPRVTVTSQPPPSASSVKLGAKVEASAGNVKALRAFVNGRAVASVDVNAPTKDIVFDVPLEAGSNVVTLVAFDDAGRSSNPRSIDIGMPPATSRPDVWVIAAGVGWYPNLPAADQLEGSVNDAYAIADAFDGQAGPGKRYDKSHITVLEDEQVTADAIDKALAQLAQMKPTDVAVVFLAGHGVRLPKTEDMVFLTGTAKPDKSTWATSGIGWTKIGAALSNAKGRVIVLLDACHSGNVTQERIVPNTQLADDLVGSQRAGVLVFAASKGSQKSLEANAARAVTLDADQQVLVQHKRIPKKKPPPPPPPAQAPTSPRERRGNGYFTGAVVAALDSPVTDINRDGVIQTSELISQVQLRVLRASRGKQTPWVARRELFGDFALSTAAK